MKKSNLYFVAKLQFFLTLKFDQNKELWDNTFTLSVYLQMHNIINPSHERGRQFCMKKVENHKLALFLLTLPSQGPAAAWAASLQNLATCSSAPRHVSPWTTPTASSPASSTTMTTCSPTSETPGTEYRCQDGSCEVQMALMII